MWKLVALMSLALVLALGGVADAKCGVCMTMVTAKGEPLAGQYNSTSVTLTISGRRELSEATAPAGATAVVMQVDGNRTKCITVSLTKAGDDSGLVTYTGTFIAYGTQSHDGRIDLAGSVYEFKVPLDGTPGQITLLDVVAPPVQVQQARPASVPVPVAPAAPVSQAVIRDEQPAPAPGLFDRVASPDGQGVLLALAVVSFLGATLLVERRRAGRMNTESAIEA